MHTAVLLLPLSVRGFQSTAFGPRLGWRTTAVAASARSIASQYEPLFHQPLSCSSTDAVQWQEEVREEVREEELARGTTTRLHRKPRDFAVRAPVGALRMASDREDSGGAAPNSEDDLLASYQERLDAEGGATSFRIRGDATQALEDAKEGGGKALNSTKAFVDWDSTKASAAQVSPSLASLPDLSPWPLALACSLSQAERLQLPSPNVAGWRHARPEQLAAHTSELWGETGHCSCPATLAPCRRPPHHPALGLCSCS